MTTLPLETVETKGYLVSNDRNGDRVTALKTSNKDLDLISDALTVYHYQRLSHLRISGEDENNDPVLQAIDEFLERNFPAVRVDEKLYDPIQDEEPVRPKRAL